MKKVLSENQRLQLIGLVTVAREHSRQLTNIAAAAAAITGERDQTGHTADAVWDVDSNPITAVTRALANLKIAVTARSHRAKKRKADSVINKRELAKRKVDELTRKYGRDPADVLGDMFHPVTCIRDGCGKFKSYHQYLSHDFEPPADADEYEFVGNVGWRRKADTWARG